MSFFSGIAHAFGGITHALGVDKILDGVTNLLSALKKVAKGDFSGFLKQLEALALTELQQLPGQLMASNPLLKLALQSGGMDLIGNLLGGLQRHGANGNAFNGLPLLGFLHKNLDGAMDGDPSVARGIVDLISPR